MIDFKHLEFLNSKTLRVSVEVKDLDYYTNVYIDSIIIDTEDTVCETGPSDNPARTIHYDGNLKSINTTIDVSDIVSDGPKMLFVYIRCTGTPAVNTPCGLDNQDSMMPVVDYQSVYDSALKLARCTSKCGCADGNCHIDVVFANFALQYFRMEQGLKNGNWSDAYDAYCWLTHKNGNVKYKGSSASKRCSCDG